MTLNWCLCLELSLVCVCDTWAVYIYSKEDGINHWNIGICAWVMLRISIHQRMFYFGWQLHSFYAHKLLIPDSQGSQSFIGPSQHFQILPYFKEEKWKKEVVPKPGYLLIFYHISCRVEWPHSHSHSHNTSFNFLCFALN